MKFHSVTYCDFLNECIDSNSLRHVNYFLNWHKQQEIIREQNPSNFSRPLNQHRTLQKCTVHNKNEKKILTSCYSTTYSWTPTELLTLAHL